MLNFDGKGRKIAKIKGGAKQKTLYLDEKAEVHLPKILQKEYEFPICPYCDKKFKQHSHVKRHLQTEACPFSHLYKKGEGLQSKVRQNKKNKLENGILRILDNSKLKPLVNDNKREVLYIAGPQGSGKSHYASEYLKEFKKIFPKKKIYMFSGIDNDENFKGINGIKKMDMDDEEMLDDPIDVKKELVNSLVIFDDIDRSNNPEITNYLHELRNDILKNGRDQSGKDKDIYCLSTNHQVTDGPRTRDLLNESTSITIFPQSGSRFGIERVLKHYLGMGKKEVDQVMNIPSRWVTIYKNYPQYLLHEKGAMMLNSLKHL